MRRARELAPQAAIDSNDAWVRNIADTQHIPEVTPADVVEADVVLFGTPTRYGNVAAQLKQFLDSLGPNWQRGELADKAHAAFTSTATAHVSGSGDQPVGDVELTAIDHLTRRAVEVARQLKVGRAA